MNEWQGQGHGQGQSGRNVINNGGGGYGGGHGHGAGGAGRKVYFGNLNYQVTWQDLKTFARQVGEVVRSDILLETSGKGRSKGCGVVEYASPADAHNAIVTLNDREFFGRPVFVREVSDLS
jgi:RNA recognition motif-containing protein